MKKYEVWSKFPLCEEEVSGRFDSVEEAKAEVASIEASGGKAWVQTARFSEWLRSNFEEDFA